MALNKIILQLMKTASGFLSFDFVMYLRIKKKKKNKFCKLSSISRMTEQLSRLILR